MANEEQFRKIREGLEKLAIAGKEEFEGSNQKEWDEYDPTTLTRLLVENARYNAKIKIINESLKMVCEVYNLKYEPIKF